MGSTKRLTASLLSLGLLLLSCSIPKLTATPPPPTPSPFPDPLKTPWEDRSLFKNGLVASEQSILNELDGASIYHINLTITKDLYEITGIEEVRYTNNESVPLNEVQFRLFPNILGGEMRISNLNVNGQTITPVYGLQNSLMIVPLPAPLKPRESVILQMDFTVTVPQSVDLNYGVLAYYENVLALAHAYPMIAVYDNEGWSAEIPPQNGDVTYADASFYIVRIIAPRGLTLVTSGREISLGEDGQAQVLTVASGPTRDFYLAASPDFDVVSQTFGGVTIHSYAPGNLRDGAKMALEVASRALEVFGKRYSPYPYTELDIVATPTRALGIEYPGIIVIADRIYDVNSNYQGEPASVYLESTVVHEMGHQWFYNLVGNDQLDDPWLDESLTQFITLQYFDDEYGARGAEGFRSSLEGRWSRVSMATIPIGMPVTDYQGLEYSAIVYGRGPLFFEALREKMGAAAFDAFIMDYTASLSWKIATPEEMQSLAEKNCNCALQALFDEWVYP
jgi:hypothetical protein